MNDDVYSFECDLDRNLPEAERSGVSVHDDGEHIVFGLARGAGDNREVYLTYGDAANLASLLDALTGADEVDDGDEPTTTAKVLASIMVVTLFVGVLVAIASGVAWLFNLR